MSLEFLMCSEKCISPLYPAPVLGIVLFICVSKNTGGRFFGIAEGEVREAGRMEAWVMHSLLAELQSSDTGPAASRSMHTALVRVLNMTERFQ